jgi:hypothetical protein
MPSILKETDKYIEYQLSGSTPWNKEIRREQKFLCVGGPFNGKYLTDTQINEQTVQYKPYSTRDGGPHSGYQRYNSSSSSGRNAPLRCVYVWLELPDPNYKGIF